MAGGDGAQVAGTLERPVPPSQDAPAGEPKPAP